MWGGPFRAALFSVPRFVSLLEDLGPDELVSMTRHGPDETRLLRVVAERAAERSNGLRQRAVRHDDVAPDLREDGLLRHRIEPAPNQQMQKIEILWNQGNRRAVAQQQSLARREDEFGETKSDRSAHLITTSTAEHAQHAESKPWSFHR
jgi:hypothetical protein